VLLVEKPDDLWEKTESGSRFLSSVQNPWPWVAVVLNVFLCFPKALCLVDGLYGWEMEADDVLRCLHHLLEGLSIGNGAAA